MQLFLVSIDRDEIAFWGHRRASFSRADKVGAVGLLGNSLGLSMKLSIDQEDFY